MNILEDEIKQFQTETKFLKKRSTIILLSVWLVFALIDVFLNYTIIAYFKAATHVYVFYFFFLFTFIPATCLLASLLIALIPMWGLNYSKKYPSITVLLMVITQSVLLGMSLHTFFKT